MLSVIRPVILSFGSAATYEFFFVLLCFPLVLALFLALINIIKG